MPEKNLQTKITDTKTVLGAEVEILELKDCPVTLIDKNNNVSVTDEATLKISNGCRYCQCGAGIVKVVVNGENSYVCEKHLDALQTTEVKL